jgi:hypothetical protein
MSPLKPHKIRPGRPRQQGERYPCGKLKIQGTRRRRAKTPAEKSPDSQVIQALALFGGLEASWRPYDPAACEMMVAARLLATHGLAHLAQRRTGGDTEYLIRGARR